jgi:hypothetical protein
VKTENVVRKNFVVFPRILSVYVDARSNGVTENVLESEV